MNDSTTFSDTVTDTPPDNQPNVSARTIADICREHSIPTDTVRKAWRRASLPRTFSVAHVPTPQEIAAVSALRSALGGSKGGVVSRVVAKPTVAVSRQKTASMPVVARVSTALPAAPETETVKPSEWLEEAAMLILPAAVTGLSIWLTTYGLHYFAGEPGLILGGMFGLILASAVIVARNPNKGDTSDQALRTVFWMEFGAFWLHCFTFYAKLPHPAIFEGFDWLVGGVLAAPCAGFASFLSYRAVEMVRDYTAE